MIVISSWIVYALVGVLVLLILWQLVTQWKVETDEAKNQRFLVLIFGVIAAALVVWFLWNDAPSSGPMSSTDQGGGKRRGWGSKKSKGY